MKKQIAILFGGRSSEHEISCQSAVTVMNGLDKEKYDLHRIGITKEGRWVMVESEQEMEDGSWIGGETTAIISPDTSQQGILFLKDGVYTLQKVDIIFPILHGLYGEDGTVQGIFELSGIPYVGCGVLSSAVSMDKLSTKLFVERIGVCQAAYVADTARGFSDLKETVRQSEERLGYPVFVKPSNAGSSQGVSKASDREELVRAIQLAKEHDTRVLIEEAIIGREIECAILGGLVPEASCVGEVLAAAEFYDYDAKYHNMESKTIIDPDLPSRVKREIREKAVQIFQAVNGFGLARVDFFVENETERIVFNEINTLPGFTSISMYPMLWNAMGKDLTILLDKIIETAGERNGTGCCS